MIGYFPTPYEDETFTSLIGRFHLHTGSRSYASTALALFGSHEARVSSHFQFRLHSFVEKTSHIFQYDQDGILNRFTLWPFYKNFFEASRQTVISDLMKSKGGKGISSVVGMNGSSYYTSLFPKYCPVCCKLSFEKHGEYYWMRSHQIPYINICPVHFCRLIEAGTSVHDRIKFSREMVLPLITEIELNKIEYEESELVRKLAIRFQDVLHGKTMVEIGYNQRLKERGYYRGEFCQKIHLRNNFNNFYSEILPLYINNRLRKISDIYSQQLVSRPTNIFHPVRHILFGYFLEQGPRLDQETYRPPNHDLHLFGTGPWPCMNKTCRYFGMMVIDKFDHHFSTQHRRTIGNFTCSCGMKYAKSFIENKVNINQYIKILDYGPVWKEKLIFLLRSANKVNNKWALHKLADALGVTGATVKMNAAKLGLNHIWRELKYQRKPRTSIANKIERRRAQFLKRIKVYKSKSDFKKENRGLCDWLRKQDKIWYYENVGSADHMTSKLKTDFNKKDSEFVIHAKSKYKELMSQNLPTMISKTTLLRVLGTIPDMTHMPLSRKFLSDGVETREAYQLRRLNNVLKRMEWPISVSKNMILTKAAIYKPTEFILKELDKTLLNVRAQSI